MYTQVVDEVEENCLAVGELINITPDYTLCSWVNEYMWGTTSGMRRSDLH